MPIPAPVELFKINCTFVPQLRTFCLESGMRRQNLCNQMIVKFGTADVAWMIKGDPSLLLIIYKQRGIKDSTCGRREGTMISALCQSAIVIALLSLSSQVRATEDIKRILRKAGNEWAAQRGTRITSSALDSGFCFSRSDYTDNRDKCANQPAGAPYSGLSPFQISEIFRMPDIACTYAKGCPKSL